MSELSLTPAEQEYLRPILERRTTKANARTQRTLQDYLRRWRALVISIEEGHAPEFELFANEVTCRQIVELDIKAGAPDSLCAKIDAALEEWDKRYVASTGEVDEAWFGDGNPQLWWWYRCPKSWYWYEMHAK